MKRLRFQTAALAVLIAGSAFGLSACDFGAARDAFNEFKIVLGLEKQKTTVGVRFVDATTGQLIPGDFEVQLGASDNTTVVDSYGDPLTKRTAKSGLVGFSIANAKVPTATAPVAVRVSATPSGYLPISQNIAISDTGAVSVKVTALRPGTSSTGTQSASQQSNASATTGIPAAMSASTPTTPPPSGGQPPPPASFQAPAGTMVRDAQNQAVSGQVTATVVAVDPTQSAALQLLPAGLSTGGFGKNAATVRVPVAVGNFSVTANGAAAGSLSSTSGITLQFNISASLPNNPATGLPWKAGDLVDAYRYTTTTGWVKDGSFTVISVGTGQFAVQTVRPTLLTGWWAATVDVTQTSTINLTVNRNGQTGGLTATLSQIGFTQTQNLSESQSTTVFTNVPTGMGRTITVSYGTNQSASVAASAGTSFTVSLTAPLPEVTVTVTPKCPDPAQGIFFRNLPSLFVYASETGKNNYFDVGDVSKIATINYVNGQTTGKISNVVFKTRLFEVGKSYDLLGSYEGNLFGPETRSVTGTTMALSWDVDGDYCQ